MAIIEISFSWTVTVDTDDLTVLALPSYFEIDTHSMQAEDIVDKLKNGKFYVDFEQCHNMAIDGYEDLQFRTKKI